MPATRLSPSCGRLLHRRRRLQRRLREHTFEVDNLKVWYYAKTDYSDRFTEGF
jgi:hypothetical protein